MDPNILSIIIGAAALIAGIIAGKIIFSKNSKKQIAEAELLSKNIIREAELRGENFKKEKELEAKERFVQMKANHDREVLDRNRKINDSENRARQKEQSISQKENNLDKQINLATQVILDRFIFFDLLIKIIFFLIDGLLFLAGTVFGIIDFPVTVHHLFVVICLHLDKAFLCFQFFFLFKSLSPQFSFPDDIFRK